jgi:hypothetical protein
MIQNYFLQFALSTARSSLPVIGLLAKSSNPCVTSSSRVIPAAVTIKQY